MKNYKASVVVTAIIIILVGTVAVTGLYFGLSKKRVQDEIPNWVKDLIEKEKMQEVSNPPASFTRCVFKNQVVYYLPSRCCDIPSILYDENGNSICAPDGGFTGKGDGRCPDFFKERKNCEVIWKDYRSYPPN